MHKRNPNRAIDRSILFCITLGFISIFSHWTGMEGLRKCNRAVGDTSTDDCARARPDLLIAALDRHGR
jgi:hypothetical protein